MGFIYKVYNIFLKFIILHLYFGISAMLYDSHTLQLTMLCQDVPYNFESLESINAINTTTLFSKAWGSNVINVYINNSEHV